MNEIKDNNNIETIICAFCGQEKDRYFKPLPQGTTKGKDICLICSLKTTTFLEEIPGRYGNLMRYLYHAFDDENIPAVRRYLEAFEIELISKFIKKLEKWYEDFQINLTNVEINLSYRETQERIELKNYWDGKKSLLKNFIKKVKDLIVELTELRINKGDI